jgi:hypothetical protein
MLRPKISARRCYLSLAARSVLTLRAGLPLACCSASLLAPPPLLYDHLQRCTPRRQLGAKLQEESTEYSAIVLSTVLAA